MVCESSSTPPDVKERSDGWRAFRIEGVLDFSLIGILAKISTLLADAGIAIFALSTYDTDYIFTRAGQFDRALQVLEAEGYTTQSPQ